MRECPICLDPMDGKCEALDGKCEALECGHVFHSACIREAAAWRAECPTCRWPIVADREPPNRDESHVVIGLDRQRPPAPRVVGVRAPWTPFGCFGCFSVTTTEPP